MFSMFSTLVLFVLLSRPAAPSVVLPLLISTPVVPMPVVSTPRPAEQAGEQPGPCRAAQGVQVAIDKASAAPAAAPSDFDRNISPFLDLRNRYPNELFVQERYQDAVQQFGIEGHLRAMTEEYQAAAISHSGDLIYEYLSARSLAGRATRSAIQSLEDIVQRNPDFAPAHRTLAEIYATEAFHDAEKEKTEREKFATMCPGVALLKRPYPLLDPSPWIERAEEMVRKNENLARAPEMALQGLRDDEWRLQRIRPFDWYTVEYKVRTQRELQVKYFRAWAVEVRAYRKTKQPEKAAESLQRMDRAAPAFQKIPGSAYWDVLNILARVYAEGGQQEQANQQIDKMKQLLAEHPDPARTVQLEEMRQTVAQRH